MASQISDYLAGKIIDHALRGEAWTPPAALYMSLHTANPGGTGTDEASGASYARQPLTLAAAVARASANVGVIDFTGMPSTTITAVGIWDSVSGGNFLWGGDTTSKGTGLGDTYEVASGGLIPQL